MSNRMVKLARRPKGTVTREDFTIEDGPVPEPGAGEFRVRIAYDRSSGMRAVLAQCLKMQGLIVFDWSARNREATTQLGQWYKEGKLKLREDVRERGLDTFPDVLNLLYTGGNFGKLVPKV